MSKLDTVNIDIDVPKVLSKSRLNVTVNTRYKNMWRVKLGLTLIKIACYIACPSYKIHSSRMRHK